MYATFYVNDPCIDLFNISNTILKTSLSTKNKSCPKLNLIKRYNVVDGKSKVYFDKIHGKHVLKNISINVSTHHWCSSGKRRRARSRGKPVNEVAKVRRRVDGG